MHPTLEQPLQAKSTLLVAIFSIFPAANPSMTRLSLHVLEAEEQHTLLAQCRID
jgi:hypothetical protein